MPGTNAVGTYTLKIELNPFGSKYSTVKINVKIFMYVCKYNNLYVTRLYTIGAVNFKNIYKLSSEMFALTFSTHNDINSNFFFSL